MSRPPLLATPRTPFGAYMHRYRRQHRLMQCELADLMGISGSYLCAMETGRREPPSGNTLDQIAAAMQLDAAQRDAMIVAAEQSRRKVLLPLQTTIDEYALFYSLLRRAGKLPPKTIASIRAILEHGEMRQTIAPHLG